MKHSIAMPLTFALLVAVAGVATSGNAAAATSPRTFYQNGGNACTGALPTFEGALRKRPKAIANEGTSVAFVTCSLPGDDNNPEFPNVAFVSFANFSGAAVNVNCTLVDGNAAYPISSTTYPQTLNVPVGATNFSGGWSPVAPATTFGTPTLAVSCALPPGIALNYFGYSINEDVGN